ncbi:MAG: sigma-E factor negative regulatory protein [Rubrivivax sp.]|nr:sigma-E factor negative regulatory protein [Rubrivivax sp.]
MTSERLTDPHDLPADDPRPWLSALADGDGQAVERACTLWRDDPQARRTWHAYHLIGDVLRSEDLAASPARDAAFLDGMRQRLAAEPVVLAPAALPRRSRPWLVPAAMAGGFVAVAGFLLVAGVTFPTGQPASPGFASSSRPVAGGVTLVTAPVRAAPPAPFIGGDGIVSDARLSEYIRAHQGVRGAVAVSAPLGMVRRVDAAVPAGPER